MAKPAKQIIEVSARDIEGSQYAGTLFGLLSEADAIGGEIDRLTKLKSSKKSQAEVLIDLVAEEIGGLDKLVHPSWVMARSTGAWRLNENLLLANGVSPIIIERSRKQDAPGWKLSHNGKRDKGATTDPNLEAVSEDE